MEPRLTGIRAVLFDLGDTLFRLHPMDFATAHQQFARLLSERLGLDDDAASAATAVVTSRLRESLRELQQSGSTAEPSIADSALPHLARFGADAPWLATALDEAFGEADIARWDHPPGRPGEVRRFIDAGFRVAFVSNTQTPPSLMRHRLAEFGLLELAEAAVFSVEVGERKPGERIYRAALEALDIRPESAVFVGDRVREDVLGPQSLGIRAVLTHEFRQEDPAEAQPAGVIQSLAALWEFL
ncbi:MAG: HAD family hydrolase [Dehalococcoidia bacterium]|nr:HAD family hydrolase [Dehalococcoidia bacterium]